MLLRAKPQRARADFFEQLQESGDAWIACGSNCGNRDSQR